MKAAHESPEEVVCFSCPDCGKVFSRLTDSVKHKCTDQMEKESGSLESSGFSERKEDLLLEKPLMRVDSEEINLSGDMLDEFVKSKEKHGKKCNV